MLKKFLVNSSIVQPVLQPFRRDRRMPKEQIKISPDAQSNPTLIPNIAVNVAPNCINEEAYRSSNIEIDPFGQYWYEEDDRVELEDVIAGDYWKYRRLDELGFVEEDKSRNWEDFFLTLKETRRSNIKVQPISCVKREILGNGDSTCVIFKPRGRRKDWRELVKRKFTFPRGGENRYNVLPDIRFGSQISIGSATGVLVKENWILTAGHVFDIDNLKSLFEEEEKIKSELTGPPPPIPSRKEELERNLRYIQGKIGAAKSELVEFRFNFHYETGVNPKNSNRFMQKEFKVDTSDIKLKKCQRFNNGHQDWALIPIIGYQQTLGMSTTQLGIHPVDLKARHQPEIMEPVYMIGHPLGVAKKFTPNGFVLTTKDAETFTTTLDAFRGNSGSPVFDTVTHDLVGILKGGEDDFTMDQQTDFLKPRTYRLTEIINGLYDGEKVQRISTKLEAEIQRLN